jgi:hypothetical protein
METLTLGALLVGSVFAALVGAKGLLDLVLYAMALLRR